MKVIRNREELKRETNNLPKAVLDSVEADIKIIEEYYEAPSDEYGPLVVLIDENEQQKMEDVYPLIKQLEPEEFAPIYEDEKVLIERTCYILTDAGYIVYVRRKKA